MPAELLGVADEISGIRNIVRLPVPGPVAAPAGASALGAAALAAGSLAIYWGQVNALGEDMFAEQDANANAIAKAAAEARPAGGGDDGEPPDDDPCWKVGDDIYKLTKAGRKPAWSTVRSRFWKNAAASPNALQEFGADNLARMQRGLAPQRFNLDKPGMESMELSHEPVPAREGGLQVRPRWPQDHARVDPFRRPGY